MPLAYWALLWVMPPGRAILPAEEDDLQMELVPRFLGKQALAVLLCLLDIFPRREPPAVNQAMDVRVYGEGGMPKYLGHNHGSRFMPHPR